MLLQYQPDFNAISERNKRLACLEYHIRQSSEGTYTITDYARWLQETNLPIPSRQTLHVDLSWYANFCDDVEYGQNKKFFIISSRSDYEAVRWFLGESWNMSLLRPQISSSIARTLLLAMENKQEVEFYYAKLTDHQVAMVEPEYWKGIPYYVFPGLDSAYMGFLRNSGKVAHLNLSRIQSNVKWTGIKLIKNSEYTLPPKLIRKVYQLDHIDYNVMTLFRFQFSGWFEEKGKIVLNVYDHEVFFLKETLNAWTQRLAKRQGVILSDWEWTLIE